MFPGQGSQVVGMGKDIADAYPVARQTFEQADDFLGFSLSDLCFNGSADDLSDTINTQPALYVCGIATLRVLHSEIPDALPGFAAGHSFGEFTALAAFGALTFEDGLRLVRERGRLMKEAGIRSPGAMAAILALDIDAVRSLCERARAETGGVLVVANDNCPGQVVISGDVATLDQALVIAKAMGVRRAIKLAVSIASHSPLMQSSSEQFKQAVAATTFQMPSVPIYGNVSAAPLTSVEAIRQELGAQLTSPVRWRESMEAMITQGAQTFVEIGPKDVLTGLLKRIDGDKAVVNLNSLENLQKFVGD
ncbi:MAG TPA: ACP S-malonyltransferase [Phototrophicaceae bacterium]|nr:ACP S-malonyltransferase [Phototrophicaceae bacterium]